MDVLKGLNIHAIEKTFRKFVNKRVLLNVDYNADGFAVRKKNLGFMTDPSFSTAWNFSEERNKAGWKGDVPDIRWRAHVCCFAARHALQIPGDLVECGVHTGILSATICKYLDFSHVQKKLFLFDTYAGIPDSLLSSATERNLAETANKSLYFDCYDIVKETFLPYQNVFLVKGLLPESLKDANIEKISYLSIDLNNSVFEEAVIRKLWDKLSPSAIVVIDDYAFKGHERQYQMWNDFAKEKGRMIMTVPTGQGLLIK